MTRPQQVVRAQPALSYGFHGVLQGLSRTQLNVHRSKA